MADWWSMDKANQPPGMAASWETKLLSPRDGDVPTPILLCSVLDIRMSFPFPVKASGRSWNFCKSSVVEEDIPETWVHLVIALWLAGSREGCHQSQAFYIQALQCGIAILLLQTRCLPTSLPPPAPWLTAPLPHLASPSPEAPHPLPASMHCHSHVTSMLALWGKNGPVGYHPEMTNLGKVFWQEILADSEASRNHISGLPETGITQAFLRTTKGIINSRKISLPCGINKALHAMVY